MSEVFGRRTLYKAIKVKGKLICVDAEYLDRTSKVFDNRDDYDFALANGWTDNPKTAVERLEAEEDAKSTNAAVRAYDDQGMSEKAIAESEVVESRTLEHLAEIPEWPKKRGRPRKV